MINSPLFCVSGMCINYRVQVPNAPLQPEALAKSKGVHREVESERSCAAKVRTHEQELHIRRGRMGDVAKETEARYCTEYDGVDAGVT